MTDIHIHRQHSLGLAKARKIALQWTQAVQEKFDMVCTVTEEGQTSDKVEFCRSGVQGHLLVTGDHFDLHAKLGFLLGAFSTKIQSEIEENLDELLANSSAERAAVKQLSKTKAALPKE